MDTWELSPIPQGMSKSIATLLRYVTTSQLVHCAGGHSTDYLQTAAKLIKAGVNMNQKSEVCEHLSIQKLSCICMYLDVRSKTLV